MKRIFAAKALVLLLSILFCLPLAAEAVQREIVFKNATARHIQFAMIHKDESGRWMKSGWYEIAPHGSYTFEDYFGSIFLYVYAKDQNSDYAWPDQSKKQDLEQTVQDAAFYATDHTGFAQVVYFQKIEIDAHKKYIWTFR